MHDVQETAGNVAWANDNKTLFYVTKDKLDRPFKVSVATPQKHKLVGTRTYVLIHGCIANLEDCTPEQTSDFFQLFFDTPLSQNVLVDLPATILNCCNFVQPICIGISDLCTCTSVHSMLCVCTERQSYTRFAVVSIQSVAVGMAASRWWQC